MLSKKKFNIDKNELYNLFIIKNYKRDDIAKYYGCSSVLIKKKCQEYGIQKPKSLENKNKKRKVIKYCLFCVKDFFVTKFRSKGKWEIKFCSHKCSSEKQFKGKHNRRELYRKHSKIRRDNMKKACIGINYEDKKLITEFYNKRPHGYEVDHIIPVSKGGKHCLSNLQYLLKKDNRRKHDKI